jgi:hypothetical protein
VFWFRVQGLGLGFGLGFDLGFRIWFRGLEFQRLQSKVLQRFHTRALHLARGAEVKSSRVCDVSVLLELPRRGPPLRVEPEEDHAEVLAHLVPAHRAKWDTMLDGIPGRMLRRGL